MPLRPDQKRRESLLEELTDIVLSEGFAHLRVGGLADRLHCSRSTLYKLAPSKDELIVMLCERYINRAIDDALLKTEGCETVREKLVAFADVIAVRQAAGSDHFWRDFRDTPETATILGWPRARGYQEVRRMLEEGVASGEFRELPVRFVSFVVWSTARASRDPELLKDFGLDQANAIRELIRLVVDGAKAPLEQGVGGSHRRPD